MNILCFILFLNILKVLNDLKKTKTNDNLYRYQYAYVAQEAKEYTCRYKIKNFLIHQSQLILKLKSCLNQYILAKVVVYPCLV